MRELLQIETAVIDTELRALFENGIPLKHEVRKVSNTVAALMEQLPVLKDGIVSGSTERGVRTLFAKGDNREIQRKCMSLARKVNEAYIEYKEKELGQMAIQCHLTELYRMLRAYTELVPIG